METKELKIVPPKGMKLTKKIQLLKRLSLRKKDDRPRTWEEFCKRGYTGEEAYVTICGVLKACSTKGEDRSTFTVGYANNVQEAEAFLALMQLRQLRKAWVGDWEPDWCDDGVNAVIYSMYNELEVGFHCNMSACLSFPNEEMAEDFMECFKDLLEQAKMLL